jgi:RNA polymerase sigma-70 factor (ECF subfamily)
MPSLLSEKEVRRVEDAEIIRLYQARSEQAVQETKRKYESLCMTVAFNMLDSREDAEECFDDALMSLWRTIPPAEPESLGAYLITVLRNAARDRLSYQQAKRRGGGELHLAIEELGECLTAPEHPERILDSLLLRDALGRFLAALKPLHRVIFLNRYWLCLSAKEISAETGYSVARINMSLMRTRKKLKAFLEQEGLL